MGLGREGLTLEFPLPIWNQQLHAAYDNPRPEVTAVIPIMARRILDVGCSTGQMGGALRARGHDVVGIESEPSLATEARTRLNRVVEGDVEAMAAAGADPGGPFDAVVFADVLEHLRDPWSVVRWAAGLLTEDGCMVVSVPNIRHA
jgi:2-polyprenyl-3-methyl-5-hydroxy-6-metoxy-1,4-benzoquinol methylase